MESDLFVYAEEEELWIECPPAGNFPVFDTLCKFVIADQVEIADRTVDFGLLSIQGPGALELVRSVTGPVDPGMPELGHVRTLAFGSACRVVRARPHGKRRV